MVGADIISHGRGRVVRGAQLGNKTGSILHVPVDVGMSSVKARAIVISRQAGGICADMSREQVEKKPNLGVRDGDRLFVDTKTLFSTVRDAAMEASAGIDPSIPRVFTIDTFGAGRELVLKTSGTVDRRMYQYSDDQRKRGMDRIVEILAPSDKTAAMRKLFEMCAGSVNTDVYDLYHLAALGPFNPGSRRVLDVADAIYDDLCGLVARGEEVTEESLTATSLCANIGMKDGMLSHVTWNEKLLGDLGLDVDAFPKIVRSGTNLGPVKQELLEVLGCKNAYAVAGATHDTAAAFAGLMPVSPEDALLLSTGTWDLLGMGVKDLNPAFMAAMFGQGLGIEGATGSKYIVSNTPGGAIFEALQKKWGMAKTADLFANIPGLDGIYPYVNFAPGHNRFSPGSDVDIVGAMDEYSVRTQEFYNAAPMAYTQSASVSIILDTAKSARKMATLMAHFGKTPSVIVAGGGVATNPMLMQWLADATGIKVRFAGTSLPALGNMLFALTGMGFATRGEVIDLLRKMGSEKEYIPDTTRRAIWDHKAREYDAVVAKE